MGQRRVHRFRLAPIADEREDAHNGTAGHDGARDLEEVDEGAEGAGSLGDAVSIRKGKPQKEHPCEDNVEKATKPNEVTLHEVKHGQPVHGKGMCRKIDLWSNRRNTKGYSAGFLREVDHRRPRLRSTFWAGILESNTKGECWAYLATAAM